MNPDTCVPMSTVATASSVPVATSCLATGPTDTGVVTTRTSGARLAPSTIHDPSAAMTTPSATTKRSQRGML